MGPFSCGSFQVEGFDLAERRGNVDVPQVRAFDSARWWHLPCDARSLSGRIRRVAQHHPRKKGAFGTRKQTRGGLVKADGAIAPDPDFPIRVWALALATKGLMRGWWLGPLIINLDGDKGGLNRYKISRGRLRSYLGTKS